MKRLLFLFIFLVFPINASANVIDLKVKSVTIGTSYSAVVRQLGKPLRSANQGSFPCGDKLLTLYYSGLVIKLDGDGQKQNFSVVSIEITTAKWIPSKGIKIGSDLKNLQTKLGQPDNETKKSGLTNLSYFINDGEANFYFKNNKLTKIVWEENLC
ncbi:MAG: hypothetical protein M3033_00660 [Acidobacteriota bacterium]|nr:hypothetical protein [Acidobacteriota bacterium]